MQAGLIQRYLGNKSSIASDLISVVRDFACPGDIVVDAFSGSLAASIALRQAGFRVISNDINHFSWLFATAFMSDEGSALPIDRCAKSPQQWLTLANELITPMPHYPCDVEFRSDIFDNYCERGANSAYVSSRGRMGRRRFFTAENAKAIDRALSRLRHWWRGGRIDLRTRCVLGAMLISAVEKVSNTQGTFHDFPRTFMDPRALKPLSIVPPPDNAFSGPISPLIGKAEDSLDFIRRVPPHSVLYLDPPYNFRQYTSYYFMLNLLSRHAEIDDLDQYFSNIRFVRGQNMEDDFQSTFCSKSRFIDSLRTLVARSKSDWVVMSYFDGRNHWGSFKADEPDSVGRATMDAFFHSDAFAPGTASCVPIARTNYQSYGGYKARTVNEFLFVARRAKYITDDKGHEVDDGLAGRGGTSSGSRMARYDGAEQGHAGTKVGPVCNVDAGPR